MLGADRPRLLEQADRARARDRGEDGQDARRPRARQARRHRPHAGRAARGARRARADGREVLGPIAAGNRDPAAPTVAAHAHRHRHRSLPRPRPRAARALPRDGLAPRHRRPRRRASSSAPPRELAALGDVVAVARRRHRPRPPRARSSRPPGAELDLLVNNASVLGPSPQPALADYPLDVLEHVYRVNVVAPLALAQLALPRLPDGRRGSSTSPPTPPSSPTRAGAATARRRPRSSSSPRSSPPSTPALRIYAVDPGDMRTQHAPGGVPRRGHLRPPAARGERARPARADRGRPRRAAATAPRDLAGAAA